MDDEELFKEVNEDLIDATRYALSYLVNPYGWVRNASLDFDTTIKSPVHGGIVIQRVVDDVADDTCKVIE